jgi:hypothetical protein
MTQFSGCKKEIEIKFNIQNVLDNNINGKDKFKRPAGLRHWTAPGLLIPFDFFLSIDRDPGLT